MKEVKSPKKPLIFYYGIVLLILIVFNVVLTPMLSMKQVKEVDYGTFMSSIEDKKISDVQVEDNQILFTEKDNKNTVYKTGIMDDPTLTERLFKSGATFAKEIDTQMSPVASFLLTGVLPLIIFIALGQYMGRKMMEQAGGKNSMAFGMGKSNAKVYVKSTSGIKFSDVAGEDEAKDILKEIVDFLEIRRNIRRSVLLCPKVPCWWALREPVKHCWQKQWQAKPMCPSSLFQVRGLWKCS